MRTRIPAITALIVLLAAAFAAPAALAGPAQSPGPLRGEARTQFNLAWPGPDQTEIPDWVGTLTIDGKEYGLAFFAIGTGKPFLDNPSDVVFFEEIWRVYDELEFTFDGFVLTEFVPGDVVMSGWDRGIVSPPNGRFRMSGEVETAVGEFEGWLGRRAYMSGSIVFGDGTVYPEGAPQYAVGPGQFRIN